MWIDNDFDIIAVQETWENSFDDLSFANYRWKGKIWKDGCVRSERRSSGTGQATGVEGIGSREEDAGGREEGGTEREGRREGLEAEERGGRGRGDREREAGREGRREIKQRARRWAADVEREGNGEGREGRSRGRIPFKERYRRFQKLKLLKGL